MVNSQDKISAALLEPGGEASRAEAIGWTASQAERDGLRRRANVCCYWAITFVVGASIASAWIAYDFASSVALLQDDLGWSEKSPIHSVFFVPTILIVIAALTATVALVLFVARQIPGHRSTVAAIDWASSADALTRLLRVGKTYPEAFQLADQVVKTTSVRTWLASCAERIAKGQSIEQATSNGDSNDPGVVAAIVGVPSDQPDVQWQAVAQHFRTVAENRYAYLTTMLPMLSMLISGLLVWLAVASTLGWMWRAITTLLGNLT